MTHKFVIEVEIERLEGKFATRDEMAEHLVAAIEEADLDGIGPDGDSSYQVLGAWEK